MAKYAVRMPSHPPADLFMGSQGLHPPEEQFMGMRPRILWVGYVNYVPLVGTSADMVDGFIALLQGDRKTAEAKGYKAFLDSAGIHDLKESIFQNAKGQTVVGCSAKVSKDINDYILQAVQKPGASASIKAAKAAQAGADLHKDLSTSFETLRGKLKERGIDLLRDVMQNKRSNRGEHVFNNALLGFYGSIIDLFIERHVTNGNRVTLVDRIPNSSVSDAFQGNAPDGEHINLTADQRRNIRTWVVHIPDNVVYIPINNILFSYMIEIIRLNAVDYMHLFRLRENNENVLRILAQSVEWMNMHRVYLDPQAAEICFFQNPGHIPQFHITEDGVQRMLRDLDPYRSGKLRDFVNQLTLAGAGFH
ncbi:uncharacterized protein LOC133131282 [Conger conger]|uniref:uncharacterized protein LOC133131282 n=1 Tax=Conger conger TaxID=82655 RepID=UPI002A59E79D|nr:uncharacterized protein LOC133131282 [Conger conger]XP_061102555.1 uncharacterized protein LOC133131282 [Conger conger]